MEYIKRKYKDVRDTFEWEYSGKSMFIRWSTVGVNSLGIWLQPYTNDQPYGFFEWKWIKDVVVAEKHELIYFVMHDMDAVYDNAVLWMPKIAFKVAISKFGDQKAITFPLRQDSLNAVVYASQHGWVNVTTLE